MTEISTHAPTHPLTYTCPCGTGHPAGVWAAAHWFEELLHTCERCGRQNAIQHGHVLSSSAPTKEVPDGLST